MLVSKTLSRSSSTATPSASSCEAASNTGSLKPHTSEPHCTMNLLSSLATGTSLPRGCHARSDVKFVGGGAGGSGGSGGCGDGGGLGGCGGDGGGGKARTFCMEVQVGTKACA